MYFSRIALAALEVFADAAGLGFSASFGLPSSPSSGGAVISMTVLPSGISPLPRLADGLSSSCRESSMAAMSSSGLPATAAAGALAGSGAGVLTAGALPPSAGLVWPAGTLAGVVAGFFVAGGGVGLL